MLLITHTTTALANIPTKPPMPANIVVEVTSKGCTVMGKEVATKKDVEDSLKKAFAALPYISESYVGGVLKFGQLDNVALTEKFTKKNKALITEGTLAFTLTASPPAVDPVSKATDPNSEYKVSVELKPTHTKLDSK